jgi:hypothetical protein
MPEWLEISVVHFIDVILICYIIFLREQSWYKIHLTKQDFDSSTLTFLTSWYACISLIMNHQQIPILQRCWKQYKKDINHQNWKKEPGWPSEGVGEAPVEMKLHVIWIGKRRGELDILVLNCSLYIATQDDEFRGELKPSLFLSHMMEKEGHVTLKKESKG